MRREVVLERAHAVVRHDVQLIQAGYDRLTGVDDELPTVADVARRMMADSTVRTTGTAPRPALRLINAIYEDLANEPSQVTVRAIGDLLMASSGFPELDGTARAMTKEYSTATACQKAEENFSYALQQIVRQRRIVHDEISVYHDETGRPLLFRKDQDEDTALTLVPTSLNGAYVPAGTIVVTDMAMDEKNTGEYRSGGFKMRSFLAANGVMASPVRLSAWAYGDPRDRTLFAVKGFIDVAKDGTLSDSYFQCFDDKAAFLASTSLRHYDAASRKVIELCAV